MKRRSNSKKPHSPHALYLDEGISSPELAKLLTDAGMSVLQYETLLERNRKIGDDVVIDTACKSGFILVTKDDAMEREWIGHVLLTKARLVMLTGANGGIAHLAAALICAHDATEKVLLDNPAGPLVIKISKHGEVTKIRGEAEITDRWNHLFQARLVRHKRHGEPKPHALKAAKKPRSVSSPSLFGDAFGKPQKDD